MQNKSAIWLFTVLLTVATLYILSFSLISSNFEKKAAKYIENVHKDSLESLGMSADEVSNELERLQRKYLRDSSKVEIVPLVGYSYEEVKQKELNLGLDLQGGMSVTLEVSIPDLVIALSDYDQTPAFRQSVQRARELQKESQDDFVSLFERAWDESGATLDLWRIFHKQETKDLFPPKSTDDEIFAILRSEAEIAIDNTENIIKKRIDQFGVAQPNVQKQSFSGRIIVELPGVDDREHIRKKLKSTANLEFWNTYRTDEIFQTLLQANDALARKLNPEIFEEKADTTASDDAASSAIDDLSDAVDDLVTDTLEDVIDDIIDPNELEGDTLNTAEELTDEEKKLRSPLFQYLSPNGAAGSCIAGYARTTDTSQVNYLLRDPVVSGQFPRDLKLYWGAQPEQSTEDSQTIFALYMIKSTDNGKPMLDGSTIVDARADFDMGDPIVSMTMDAAGTQIWGEMTTKAAADNKRAVAIVMDNLVYSAPSVNTPITDGRSQITMGGNLTTNAKLKETQSLSGLLKAGSLPAPAKIVDEYTVGPSLGAENISSGIKSFIIALAVILIYMIFYYRGAGIVSNIALIANLFFLIGALASLGAALTLPGIAGIVLTIGMAVDANVLIYERIREEMRHGKGLGAAVKDGYQKAYSAIIDANITTLLTAIILFAFGAGPIQGFATTLIIGIFTSLFSAIVITRLIFFNRLEKKKKITFYSRVTKDWFTNLNFQFVAKRKVFYVISGLIIAGGIVSLTTRGLHYGVDFEGGSSYTVEFEKQIDDQQLRDDLVVAFTEDGVPGNPTVQAVGGSGTKYKIVTSFLIKKDDIDKDEKILAALQTGLSAFGDYETEEVIKVDPSISDDFRRGARNATVFSLLVIFLYIFFRFRKWQYGLGALVAMIHDVIIVLSLFSIFYGVLPFSLEVNQAFIAAILTVIGYSINDTVVVFDRIREYLKEHIKDEKKTVINNALNSTLSRTINTSLSTFVVLLTIFIFGGNDIRGFSFALMAGVIVGTYSSIFIATPAVIDLSKDIEKD